MDLPSVPRKLTVWILQTGEPLPIDPGDPRPMRAMNLADALLTAGHRVVLWSSSFAHVEKRHRVARSRGLTVMQVAPNFELRLMDSPGYRRNIGFGRLWDHACMAHALRAALALEPNGPDVAFVGFPPIETAAVMARWLVRRRVPFLVDVKDQWPEIFVRAMPSIVRPVARVALEPYFHLARRAMRDADGLTAMASGFLGWALSIAGRERGSHDHVLPLSAPEPRVTEQQRVDAGRWWDDRGVRDDGRVRLIFVGSHSAAFDIEPVVSSARGLAKLNVPCQFVICGTGNETPAWQRKFAGLDNVVMPGWIDRPRIVELAARSHAALAPYRDTPDFRMSIPNKVLDAMSLGLPVFSPLHGEVADLIAEYQVGVSYGGEGAPDLMMLVRELQHDRSRFRELGLNARNRFEACFSPHVVYGGMARRLESLAEGE